MDTDRLPKLIALLTDMCGEAIRDNIEAAETCACSSVCPDDEGPLRAKVGITIQWSVGKSKPAPIVRLSYSVRKSHEYEDLRDLNQLEMFESR